MLTETSRANHSNFDIDAEQNDFAGLNFAALDTLAGYREPEEDLPAGGQTGGVEDGIEDARSLSQRGNQEEQEVPVPEVVSDSEDVQNSSAVTIAQ